MRFRGCREPRGPKRIRESGEAARRWRRDREAVAGQRVQHGVGQAEGQRLPGTESKTDSWDRAKNTLSRRLETSKRKQANQALAQLAKNKNRCFVSRRHAQVHGSDEQNSSGRRERARRREGGRALPPKGFQLISECFYVSYLYSTWLTYIASLDNADKGPACPRPFLVRLFVGSPYAPSKNLNPIDAALTGTRPHRRREHQRSRK